MTAQITHVVATTSDGREYYRQIVSAQSLRRILKRSGDTLSRPTHFGVDDEWDVGDQTDDADDNDE